MASEEEISKSLLLNPGSPDYLLLKGVMQISLSYINNNKNNNKDKNIKLCKRLLHIYAGQIGRQVVDYLMEYGASTTFTLCKVLGEDRQAIEHNLRNLVDIELLHHAVLSGPPYKMMGNNGRPPTLWSLKCATPRAIEKAVQMHMRLKNPRQARLLDEQAEAESEAQRQHREAIAELARREEEAKILFAEYKVDQVEPIRFSEFRNWLRDVKSLDFETAKDYAEKMHKMGKVGA
jgi:hypothetical protein